MIQFVRCMRAEGVRMADPFHRAGHSGLTLDMPAGATSTAAYARCGHYLGPIIAMKAAGARAAAAPVRLALIRYAQCMRVHGIPMLDPTANGVLSLGNVPGLADGPGRYTPQFRSADSGCRHLLPASVHDNGTGP